MNNTIAQTTHIILTNSVLFLHSCLFLVKIKETNFLRNTITECLACGKQQVFHSFPNYWQRHISTRYLYICLCVCSGLGGSPTNTDAGRPPHPGPGKFVVQPQHLTQCRPGTCFREDMCILTESGGVQCAPCPDGYTGDGVHCDDIDEVWLRILFVPLQLCMTTSEINLLFFLCVLEPF